MPSRESWEDTVLPWNRSLPVVIHSIRLVSRVILEGQQWAIVTIGVLFVPTLPTYRTTLTARLEQENMTFILRVAVPCVRKSRERELLPIM